MVKILEMGENDVPGGRSLCPDCRNPAEAPLGFVQTSGGRQGGVRALPGPGGLAGRSASPGARLRRVESDDLGVNRSIGNGQRRRAEKRAGWTEGARPAAGSRFVLEAEARRERGQGRYRATGEAFKSLTTTA